jgi:hypothetical protein
MRSWLIAIGLILFAAAAWAAPITASVNEKTVDAMVTVDDQAMVRALNELGLTIVDRTGQTYRLLASEAEIEFLERAGFEVVVLGRHELGDRALYRTYPEAVQELQDIATQYPSLAERFEIGVSFDGHKMYALKLSTNVAEDENEPAILFDGSIHGDESIGTAVVFAFIYHLLDNYGSVPEVTALVDDNEFWFVPVVNPDGLNAFRGNGDGVDLNRNYPFTWEGPGQWSGEPETHAVMGLALATRPVLAVSYHAGAEIINYCWDGMYTLSPDNDLEIVYSNIYDGPTGYGIINGADWYIANGTAEDWYHGTLGAMAVIVELSMAGMPPAGVQQNIIDRNLPAMIAWSKQSWKGVHGVVTSAANGAPLEALIVADERLPMTSDPSAGDYYRPLPNGGHVLHVWANGYGWREVNVQATAAGTTVDLALAPTADSALAAMRCVANAREDNNDDPANVSLPVAALGGGNGVAYSLGVGGHAVFEMGDDTPLVDGAGADLTVIEKGDDEGYEVLVSKNWTGPWKSLGTGSGTQNFDLQPSGLTEAMYVKIIDDGDGANTGTTPGADIDAIEATPVCERPFADFTASPTSGVAPLDVAFQALAEAAPGCLSGASWNFGDGETANEWQPTHRYNDPGVYTVRFTATGPAGEDEAIKQDYVTVTAGGDDDDDDDSSPDPQPDDDDPADDDDNGGGCGC